MGFMGKSSIHRVHIDSVSMSNVGFIVFLKQDGDERVLPIFVGPAEAQSIASILNDRPFPRPLSHDLFQAILSHFEIPVDHIVINDLLEGTFYAQIVFEVNGHMQNFDARPSDAMALALRFECPIFVAEHVYESAAVQMEDAPTIQDVDDESPADLLEKLQDDMEKAIRHEKYEDAAKIRDDIANLKSENLI